MAEIANLHRVSAWTVAARLDRAGVRRCTGERRMVLPVQRAVANYLADPSG
jgi:hypothetical protein